MEIDSSFLFSFVTPFVKGRVFLNKNRLKNSQSLYKCASINSNGAVVEDIYNFLLPNDLNIIISISNNLPHFLLKPMCFSLKYGKIYSVVVL